MFAISVIAFLAAAFFIWKNMSKFSHKQIDAIVKQYWSERGDGVPNLKQYESKEFSEKQLLARNLFTLEVMVSQLGLIHHAVREITQLIFVVVAAAALGLALLSLTH